MINTKIRLLIFFAAKDGEALYRQQKDWELTVAQIMNLIAKFRLKLKKVGKTTRPFRYDLNQILYDYTIGVRNRFQGIRSDRVPEELWTDVYEIVKEAGIKTICKKKKCKKAKRLKRPYK